jgi:hypothetical protein
VSRWQPPDPALRLARINVEGKLLAAQLRREIPGQHGYSPRRDDVKYGLTFTRVVATGEIICNVRIENFEHLAICPGDPRSVQRWIMTSGMVLVRLVDQVVGRDTFTPELGGRTLLIPGEEFATSTPTLENYDSQE